ncbi:response regulator transcription factor [Sulfurimonas sp.]|nr:response regulator transcription factor [Sulfurimonas sp.]
MNLTILVVEDDETSRNTLVSMLELDFAHVYSSENGCIGLDKFKEVIPDIIITDISMPCLSGLEMVDEIRKMNSTVPVIYLSAHSEVEVLQKAIDLNASGYIVKPFIYDELVQKIKDNTIQNNYKSLDILSKREKDIFLDIAKGIKPYDIALKYDIKSKTVSTYRNRILEKLNINNNTDLIKLAIANNII